MIPPGMIQIIEYCNYFQKISPFGLELTCLRHYDNLIICSSGRFIKVFSADTGEQVNEIFLL